MLFADNSMFSRHRAAWCVTMSKRLATRVMKQGSGSVRLHSYVLNKRQRFREVSSRFRMRSMPCRGWAEAHTDTVQSARPYCAGHAFHVTTTREYLALSYCFQNATAAMRGFRPVCHPALKFLQSTDLGHAAKTAGSDIAGMPTVLSLRRLTLLGP